MSSGAKYSVPSLAEGFRYNITDTQGTLGIEEIFGNKLPVIHGGWILDLGCGRGNVTNSIGSHYSDSRILAVDMFPDRIEDAKKRNFGMDNIDYLVADAFTSIGKSPKLNQGQFDAIFSPNTIYENFTYEKQPHHLKIMEVLAKYAKLGGQIFISGERYNGKEAVVNYLILKKGENGLLEVVDKLDTYDNKTRRDGPHFGEVQNMIKAVGLYNMLHGNGSGRSTSKQGRGAFGKVLKVKEPTGGKLPGLVATPEKQDPFIEILRSQLLHLL